MTGCYARAMPTPHFSCDCIQHIFHVSKVQVGRFLWLEIYFHDGREPSKGFGLRPYDGSRGKILMSTLLIFWMLIWILVDM